jgi:hypothetical protein
MSKRRSRFFTTSVMGQKWEMHAMRDDDFAHHTGIKSAAGVTLGSTRDIVINLDHVDRYTMVHELVHAYVFEMCVDSNAITNEAMEEVMAEMFARHGKQIFKQAGEASEALRDYVKYSLKK